jgi:hypothetical protein
MRWLHRPKAFRYNNANYQRKKLPGPGSKNVAFTDLILDQFSPIGNGTQIMAQPWVTQGPYLPPPHLIGLSGIGGVEVVYTDQNTPLIVNQAGGDAPTFLG